MNNRPGLGRSSRARLALGVATVLAVAAPLAISGVAAAAEPAVPAVSTASNGGSAAQWTTRTVAPGVEVRTGTVRNPAAAPTWTVTVQAAVTSRFGTPAWAVVGTESWASATVSQLRAAGFEPDTTRVPWPDYADTPRGLMGVRVRVGSYPTQDAAKSTASQVTAAGFRTVVEWTGYDADQPADVENIQVAVIDPRRFTGSVKATHDGNVAQRETTSSVAAKLGSLVGVNGGFFLTSAADGVQGVQAGIGAYDGELASMAVGSRAALILGDGGRHNRIADLTTTVTASAGRFDRAVQGINRTPGWHGTAVCPAGLPPLSRAMTPPAP